jgi:hypothetical protein
VDRIDAKLMRLGDWWRLQDGSYGAGDDPVHWVWVVAWWGDDFPIFSGQQLRGVRYTWAAHAGSALGGNHNESLPRAFPPPVWDDLPDYAPAG